MRETAVETHLRREVKKLGGECLKFVSPGRVGVPDRIVVLPTYHGVVFVETKAPGKKPKAHQARVHARLRKLYQDVRVLDTKEKVNKFLKEVAR